MKDDDHTFDRQLPERLRQKADLHFTPVAVAQRAARLLATRPGMRVLDVGSGAGKFCVVAAAEVPTATFVGIEIRPHLVHLARKLAARAGMPNAEFVHGDALAIEWADYDAFYFYNPFGEQLHGADFPLDRSLRFAPAAFDAHVAAVVSRLATARLGTRVVTYHGFGGVAPAGYDLVERQPAGNDQLELWIKHRDPAT